MYDTRSFVLNTIYMPDFASGNYTMTERCIVSKCSANSDSTQTLPRFYSAFLGSLVFETLWMCILKLVYRA